MKNLAYNARWVFMIALGCAIFALGFDLFLEPNGLTAGGISGIALIVVHLAPITTVGVATALMNFPLFFFGGRKIGVRFFVGSIIGTVFFSVFIDLFAALPVIETEPLLAAIYGGVICGAGLGIVFVNNASTGGSDIVIRLLKMKYRNAPLGTISLVFDFCVCAATGLVFGDVSNMLYSLIAVFATSQMLDMVIYKFDFSRVAYIISKEHKRIADSINYDLRRGVTYLYAQGYYTGNDTKVILTAVKQGQLADLKDLVVRIDPDAFIIVQDAHQVLGDGFARHSHDSL
ncbi:MAG: YitT family protein [Oscillospiraceae bacterium]|nr:YitT family protein [Oscillospiraceae bacterium]